MTKVFEGTEHEYYMDGYLRHAFDTAKKEIKNDWDFVFVYDGIEGSGKSVKAQQDAFYCDPTLTYEQYAFTPDEFKNAIHNAKQYQSVIYDEAHSGLNSRAAMTQVNKSLVSMLTEIRQKNLFVFIVLPTFFDLDKYVALWRSRALIHIYTSKSFQRGYFAFFNVDRKKTLYVLGKKLYKYNAAKPNFIGRFTNHYCLDQVKYRELKLKSLTDSINNKQKKEDDKDLNEVIFKRFIGINTLTNKEKYTIMGISETTFYKKLKKYTKE